MPGVQDLPGGWFGTGPGGQFTDIPGGSSSNQYFDTMPSATPAGWPNTPGTTSAVPGTGTAPGSVPASQTSFPQATGPSGGVPTTAPSFSLGGGYTGVSPIAPGETENTINYLNSQVGKGTTPFDLATPLPSGGSTQKGQLTAPENPVLKQIQQFFQTGKAPNNASGLNTLEQLANTGDPVTALPAWQAAVKAGQQNILQNEAQLKEQFASSGSLSGSEFGTSMANYMEQTSLDQNSQLYAAQFNALEQATQMKFNASSFLTNAGSQVSNALQGLDQNAVQNLLAEFTSTQPQYNPLLSLMFGAATTFPPVLTQKYGLGGLSAALTAGASAASAAASIYSTIKGAQSTNIGDATGGSDPNTSSAGGVPGA